MMKRMKGAAKGTGKTYQCIQTEYNEEKECFVICSFFYLHNSSAKITDRESMKDNMQIFTYSYLTSPAIAESLFAAP